MYVAKIKRLRFFQIIYFVDGKRKTLSTKTSDRNAAQKVLENFRASFTQPVQEITNNNPNEISPSLSKFRDEYLEFIRSSKSKKYFESISYSFKQLISFCGDIPLNKIETKMIDKFICSTFNRTPRGAHHYYRTLKAALNKATSWDYISVNPFTKIKFPKLSKSFPAFLSEDKLLIILTNTPYQYLKDIFTVGFYTGLRLGELINMKWNWIDFFQNHITVKCSDDFITKSKKERNVPMSEKVQAILVNRFNLAVHQPDEVVFYRIERRKLHQETISKQFKRAVRKSNLNENIHFHSLRHSFASLLAQKGVSLYIIKELLGHEDLATTQIYSHLQQQNLKDAVNLL